jgi:hypothetical protein
MRKEFFLRCIKKEILLSAKKIGEKILQRVGDLLKVHFLMCKIHHQCEA